MNDTSFLCRPVVFCAPERVVDPPSWLEHIPFAFWIVDALRPRTLVELGCHSGNSYASFAQAVQTLGLSTACYAVDTWLGDPHSGVLDEDVYREWAAYHDRRYASFSRLIRSTFDEALAHFADGTIDLLHIDGYHTFEAASHDFQAWRPKLSTRGVVLCHDVNVREKDFGAWQLWEQLHGEYPSFELRHGHGLGVLGIGSDLPAPVRWLLALDGDAATLVRSFFSRLGGTVLAQHTATAVEDQLRAERLSRDEQTVRTTLELEGLRAENAELRAALAMAEERDTLPGATAAESRLAVNADRDVPTIVVVSHVGPWRPRSGNEYRLERMLRWYRSRGYRVIPVIAPLPGEELAAAAVAETAALFGNAIQVHRDGRLEHDLRDIPRRCGLPAVAPSRPATLDDDLGSTPRKQELSRIDRTFCHDAVISTVLHLQESLGPHILQVEYIWMTRLLPLVRPDVLTVVDTIDVFSTIEQKVSSFGIRDVTIDAREEAARLTRADVIIAIQEEERRALKRLAASVPVVSAGVDFDVVADPTPATRGQVLYVASDNQRNCKGLRDFVQLAWPRIRQRVPNAHLIVVGSVGKTLRSRRPPALTLMGQVDDVTPLYQQASLVINPVVAGTGVKIKTIEALCHLRPVVTWPAGVEGLDPALAAFCTVARDWYEFANLVIGTLSSNAPAGFCEADRIFITGQLSPATVYSELDRVYASYFEQQRPGTASPDPLPAEAALGVVATHAN